MKDLSRGTDDLKGNKQKPKAGVGDSDWRAWAVQHIFLICFALSCITHWDVLSHSLLWKFIIHSLVLTGLMDNSSLDSEIVTAGKEEIP